MTIMAKLSPDYIEWVLKLNAAEAQKEIHKLEVANKLISKQMKSTRQAMTELEKQGKKGTSEWKNLSKSLKLSKFGCVSAIKQAYFTRLAQIQQKRGHLQKCVFE